MGQGKIISCIAVCPNACGCDTMFWKENGHTQLREKLTEYEL